MNSTAESYRRYWSLLTGRPEREVYIPLALREPPATGVGPQARRAVQESMDRRG